MKAAPGVLGPQEPLAFLRGMSYNELATIHHALAVVYYKGHGGKNQEEDFAMSVSYGKNRQWTSVLYNENMRPDWQWEIDNLVQLPYAYCVHDKGLHLEKNEKRKVHTHMIIVWPSPTTYKHAMEVFGRLSAEGKRAFNTIEPVYNARQMYDYLIHDTEDCRKKGKWLFDPSERITGNNYDIGSYQQVSMTEKNEAFDKLTDMVLRMELENFADFVQAAADNFPEERDLMRDVIRGYSGYFDRLIKGVYLRGVAEMQEIAKESRGSHEDLRADHDGSHDDLQDFCK